MKEAFQTEYDLYQLLPTIDLKRPNLMQDLFILGEREQTFERVSSEAKQIFNIFIAEEKVLS